MDSLSDLHSLWIGPRVTWLEQLCLASWLAHGHRAVVWAYQPIEGLPSGVDVRDARELLPEEAIVLHRPSGSASLFSNRFRYHLLRRYPVTWIDTDVLLLRPLPTEAPYLFAWETPDSICSAVLRLPSGSRALSDLIAYTDARVPVPPWWPLKDRIRQRALGIMGRHERAEDMVWGSFGPRALTRALRRHGLTGSRAAGPRLLSGALGGDGAVLSAQGRARGTPDERDCRGASLVDRKPDRDARDETGARGAAARRKLDRGAMRRPRRRLRQYATSPLILSPPRSLVDDISVPVGSWAP
jgi:hypothetical protein